MDTETITERVLIMDADTDKDRDTDMDTETNTDWQSFPKISCSALFTLLRLQEKPVKVGKRKCFPLHLGLLQLLLKIGKWKS